MAAKSNKEPKSTGKTNHVPGKDSDKKTTSKSRKPVDEDEEEDELEEENELSPASKKSSRVVTSKKGTAAEDDDDEAEEVKDDWEKVEEEEDWDPDFDEFDLPKSKGKKASGTAGKKGAEEEVDFKFDDDFKDMDLFNDRGFDDDDDEDY